MYPQTLLQVRWWCPAAASSYPRMPMLKLRSSLHATLYGGPVFGHGQCIQPRLWTRTLTAFELTSLSRSSSAHGHSDAVVWPHLRMWLLHAYMTWLAPSRYSGILDWELCTLGSPVYCSYIDYSQDCPMIQLADLANLTWPRAVDVSLPQTS